MRRIREDRAEHGADHSCSCFDTSGRGLTFSQFADNPKMCSGYCCGNPRKWFGELTRQEKKAPRAQDWE